MALTMGADAPTSVYMSLASTALSNVRDSEALCLARDLFGSHNPSLFLIFKNAVGT